MQPFTGIATKPRLSGNTLPNIKRVKIHCRSSRKIWEKFRNYSSQLYSCHQMHQFTFILYGVGVRCDRSRFSVHSPFIDKSMIIANLHPLYCQEGRQIIANLHPLYCQEGRQIRRESCQHEHHEQPICSHQRSSGKGLNWSKKICIQFDTKSILKFKFTVASLLSLPDTMIV